MDTIEQYGELLNALEFGKLEKILSAKPFKEMEDILYRLAYNPNTEESNLLVYTFMQNMMYKQESSTIHLSLSRLMGSILNHIEHAEQIGLYHGLRALELDPDNLAIKEYLLYYNHIPERLLADDKAIALAHEIVKVNPSSKAAAMTLGKLN
jgi:hypothetical protein